MKAIVGVDGVLVPRRMLRGLKEVRIRKEGITVVVEPVVKAVDSIFDLGKNPVETGLPDGAERHDAYLYGRE